MQESTDNLSVYGRIEADDIPHCCCGECKYCNARKAAMLAMNHLAQLISGNPPNPLTLDIASIFLNPGIKNISTLVRYLQGYFSKDISEAIFAAAEFRKCETMEEASKVAEKFPLPVTV